MRGLGGRMAAAGAWKWTTTQMESKEKECIIRKNSSYGVQWDIGSSA
jgi:hypothetical protein